MQTSPGTIGGFDEEEEAGTSTATSVLAILAVVAAVAALALQIMTTKVWADSDNPNSREFSDAFSIEN